MSYIACFAIGSLIAITVIGCVIVLSTNAARKSYRERHLDQ